MPTPMSSGFRRPPSLSPARCVVYPIFHEPELFTGCGYVRLAYGRGDAAHTVGDRLLPLEGRDSQGEFGKHTPVGATWWHHVNLGALEAKESTFALDLLFPFSKDLKPENVMLSTTREPRCCGF